MLAGRTIYRYRLPDGARVPAVLAALSRERRVASAQPNYRFSTPRATFKLAAAGGSAATIDPSLLYAPRALRLAEAHQVARGDRVLVAVIDSAVDPAHPELAGALAKSLDVTGTDGTAAPHSHGTGMAGALAARAQLVGVAPGASLIAITAFRPEGEGAGGTTVTVLRGLDAAFAEGARVVNMSFAGPNDALLGRALAGAHERGLILVAAAGNAGPKSPPLYPAADRNVIAVTATDADDKVFDQANRGRYVTIAAPGVDVLVPGPEGAYAFTSGTSVAAAHVVGRGGADAGARPDTLGRRGARSPRRLGARPRQQGPRRGLWRGRGRCQRRRAAARQAHRHPRRTAGAVTSWIRPPFRLNRIRIARKSGLSTRGFRQNRRYPEAIAETMLYVRRTMPLVSSSASASCTRRPAITRSGAISASGTSTKARSNSRGCGSTRPGSSRPKSS